MSPVSKYFLRNCSIGFKCSQTWESLEEIGVKSVRHCKDCSREVVRCDTVSQLKSALSVNACIAVKAKIFESKSDFVGLVVPKDKQR
jgi:hypothetical protein